MRKLLAFVVVLGTTLGALPAAHASWDHDAYWRWQRHRRWVAEHHWHEHHCHWRWWHHHRVCD
jgi:hypothetical protein